jgi:hypothetical protein
VIARFSTSGRNKAADRDIPLAGIAAVPYAADLEPLRKALAGTD